MLPGICTIAGTGGPTPMVRNCVVCNRAGTPLIRTLVAIPPVALESLRHGAGEGGMTNGQGAPPGIEATTSATVSAGAPPIRTVGAVVGMILNIPPCEHMMIALALRIGGIGPELLRPRGVASTVAPRRSARRRTAAPAA